MPKAELLLTDGTTKTVELTAAVADWDPQTGSNQAWDADKYKGTIVSYSINNKDKYTLTSLDAPVTKGSTQLTTNNSSSLTNVDAGLVGNGKTIFLVKTSTNDGPVYTVYTGIKAVPTITSPAGATYNVSYYAKTAGVATLVYIDATAANTSIVTGSSDVVFVKYDATVKMTDNSIKGKFYTYDAVVNGQITTIDVAAKADGTSPITHSAMFTTMSTDVNGVVTLGSELTTANPASNTNGGTGIGTVKAENGTIGLGTGFYAYADNCQVFYVDTNGNISQSSVAGIATDKTDDVDFKITDGEVTTIVITQVNSPAKTLVSVTATVPAGQTGGTGATGTVNESAKTFGANSLTGSATIGNKIIFTPTVSAGATANTATATFNGSTWVFDTPIIVTAEDGTTVTYTGA